MTTVQDERRERVVSYVRHEVEKGPDGIREAVQKGHEQLLGLIDGLSEEQATFRASPDEWSVVDTLRHVIGAKRGTARLCHALAKGAAPPGRAETGRLARALDSLAEARSALEEGHQELLAFVDSISPQTNLDATFEHPWFGPFNCQEWAAFQRVHDADHAGQIEQITAAPGFPAG